MSRSDSLHGESASETAHAGLEPTNQIVNGDSRNPQSVSTVAGPLSDNRTADGAGPAFSASQFG